MKAVKIVAKFNFSGSQFPAVAPEGVDVNLPDAELFALLVEKMAHQWALSSTPHNIQQHLVNMSREGVVSRGRGLVHVRGNGWAVWFYSQEHLDDRDVLLAQRNYGALAALAVPDYTWKAPRPRPVAVPGTTLH